MNIAEVYLIHMISTQFLKIFIVYANILIPIFLPLSPSPSPPLTPTVNPYTILHVCG